ncbi:MAG: N-acetyl-gamma-glutamyl-phosphate reductase [Acidimicrobiales bacterium]
MISVGIIGASGYAGVELLRLCAAHPELDVVRATGDTQAGTLVRELYPSLAAVHPDLAFEPYEPGSFQGIDLAFLCLPHGASQAIVPQLRGEVRWVVDVAADFRLHDASLYPEWYGEAHAAPELLGEFVYGLPELFRKHLEGATAVAVPGCYPTASILTLTPLVRAGLIEPTGIIVDAACGASGAGRPPKPNTTFCTVDEDFTAYGLLTHRHTPEIEQAVGEASGLAGAVQVLFTPHLAPMNRGILATCYGRAHGVGSTADVLDCLHDAYDDEPFIVVTDGSPSTKATLGSNVAHITGRYDARTGTVVAIGAIDNLVKGTAGQAIQSVNVIAGLPEVTGLPIAGVYP